MWRWHRVCHVAFALAIVRLAAANHPGAPRVAALFTHLEGNLGDEMETTPVLRMLVELGYKVDIFCSSWKAPHPSLRVSAHAVRELAYASDIFYSEPLEEHAARSPSAKLARDAFVGRNYTAFVIMPGPIWSKRLRQICVHARKQATKPLTIAIGVTINGLDTRSQGLSNHTEARLRRGWQRDCAQALVIAREAFTVRNWNAMVSREGATRTEMELCIPNADVPCPALGSALLMGDSSFSFQPTLALQAMWRAYYADWARTYFQRRDGWKALVFHRRSNGPDAIIDATPRKLQLRLLPCSRAPATLDVSFVYNSCVAHMSGADSAPPYYMEFLPSEVLFATSDVDLDAAYLKLLVEKLKLPARSVMLLENVEQMWALIEVARDAGALVLSDRYHPLVAAHVLGASARPIAYPAEHQKMDGVNRMLQVPGHQVRALNSRAWRCLRAALDSHHRFGVRTAAAP